MMRSLYSGVSGLKNHQTRMDVIGNNISNVNTTGFKSSRVTFADSLSQTLSGASAADGTKGGTNPKQIGLGSSVSAIDTLFTDGSVQSTGVNTDLCLSGSGLFIVKNGADTYYTRNGNFKFDEQGYYVNSDGLKVQGWTVTKLGDAISTKTTPTEIKIEAGKQMSATATTTATFSQNLDAEEPLITSMSLTLADGSTKSIDTGSYSIGQEVDGSKITAITLNLSDDTTVTETTGSYTVGYSEPQTTLMTVYDSIGSVHSVTVYMTKTGADNTGSTWLMQVNPDGSGTTTIPDANKNPITISMTDAEVKFDTNGGYAEGSGSTTLTLSNGAVGTQTVQMNFTSLTQYAGSSTAYATTDGNAPGKLKEVSIDTSGVITGTFDNGLNISLAQVAVAKFNNASGLTKSGNSLYKESNNSGTANVGTASNMGCTITPSSLEMSNVDLATELTDMIVTQRGYQSNSKIITVSDELLETLINMKR